MIAGGHAVYVRPNVQHGPPIAVARSRIQLGIVAREDTLSAVDLAGPPVLRRVGTLYNLDPVASRERQVALSLKSQHTDT